MVKTILVFALVVFDSVLILNLVMPKNYSNLANLIQISIIYENLRENIYILKNIATILFYFTILFTLSDLNKAYNKNNI